jgi:hypothetical protein
MSVDTMTKSISVNNLAKSADFSISSITASQETETETEYGSMMLDLTQKDIAENHTDLVDTSLGKSADFTDQPLFTSPPIPPAKKMTVEEKIDQVRSDLEDLRERRRVFQYQFHEMQSGYYKQMVELHRQWSKCKGRINIQLYAKIMENEFGNTHMIPQKILTQQAHLCRTLHQMEVHECALKLVDDQNRDMVKFMNKQIAMIQEEESNVEMELMNQLCKLDAIVKTMQSVLGIVPNPKDDWQASVNQSMRRINVRAAPSPPQGIMGALKGLWTFGKKAAPPPPVIIEEDDEAEPSSSDLVGEEREEQQKLNRRAQTVAFINQS